MPKKKNSPDATQRNVRAANKAKERLADKLAKLGDRVKVVEQRLKHLERRQSGMDIK